ncbi:unnamed protein product [Parnassius mnemosyne]
MRRYNRIVQVFFLILTTFYKTDGDCVLSLKNDFGEPSPVYVKNGTFLSSTTPTGDILMRRSEKILVGCPGKNRYVVFGGDATDFEVAEVQCISDTIFRYGLWLGEFKDIRCNAPPWFTVEPNYTECFGGRTLYKVGYQVGGEFLMLYEACFDSQLLTTLYVRHELSPANSFYQRGVRRSQFIDTGLFGKYCIARLYSTKNQRARFNDILGDRMDQRYITRNQFLTRGHLAPRVDFTLSALQRATFHYINAAPQWLRGNAGDWAALEDAVRRRAHSNGSRLVVYTGTHGVCTLADAHNEHHELFLHVDDNNNGIVPVPLYYYKVVYDPKKETAVAFVSINSPFYNRTMVDQLTFCDDICDGNRNYSWLRWRPNDGTHSFCCDYEEFVKVVEHLPKLVVRDRFY